MATFGAWCEEPEKKERDPQKITDLDALMEEAGTAMLVERMSSQCAMVDMGDDVGEVPIPIFGGSLDHHASDYYGRAIRILRDRGELGSEWEYDVQSRLACYHGWRLDHKKALAPAARCVALQPTNPQAHALEGKLFGDLGRHADAARSFYRAARFSGLRSPWKTTRYVFSGIRQHLGLHRAA